MKIRFFLFIFSLFFFVSKNIYTQTNDFAPVGAKWWYGISPGMYYFDGYYTIESIKDTVKNGKNCRLLESSIIMDNIAHFNNSFFVYENGDTVFYFIDSLSGESVHTEFQILYIFNNPDAKWEISYGDFNGTSEPFLCYDDSLNFVEVDSTGIEMIGGNDLNISYYHINFSESASTWVFEGSKIYEVIGNEKYLSPIPTWCWTEDYFPYGIRCYEDSLVGLIKFTGDELCEIYTAVEEANIKFSYNQNGDLLYLNSIPMESTINIFDIVGQQEYFIVCHEKNGIIDLSGLQKGLLMCSIYNDVGFYKTFKFINL